MDVYKEIKFCDITDMEIYNIVFNSLYSGYPKRVILQTVKTQMKCSIMLHFIRVNTVCEGQNDLQTK